MAILDYSPRGIAPCSGYGWTTFDNTGDYNLISAYLGALNVHNRSRIRQNGTVKEVEFRMNLLPGGLSGVYISIWRWTGTTYTKVGESENLVASLSVGVNRIVLASPITNCQEGDFVGVVITGTPTINSVMSMSTATTGNSHLRFVQSDPGSTINWDQQASVGLGNKYIQVRCYMDSPAFVFIGDSHIAGANENFSHIEDKPVSQIHTVSAPTVTTPYQFAQLADEYVSLVTYQNMGIGGETIVDTAARFQADAKDLLPHTIVSMSAWNDVRNGVTDPTNFEASLNTQMNHARTGASRFLYIEGAPLTGETNGEHQTFDSWMAIARDLIDDHTGQNNFIYQRYLTGQFRAGGDAGNQWDWLPGYAAGDLIHPTPAAKAAVAVALSEQFFDILFPPTIIATPGAEDANCYVTLAEADAYFLHHPLAATWSALSVDERDAFLIQATEDIEMESLAGFRFNDERDPETGARLQALHFPRTTDVTSLGVLYIPAEIKKACYEQAIALAQIGTEATRLRLQLQGVVEAQIGDVRERYRENGLGTGSSLTRKAYRLLLKGGFIELSAAWA